MHSTLIPFSLQKYALFRSVLLLYLLFLGTNSFSCMYLDFAFGQAVFIFFSTCALGVVCFSIVK
jgi:hypothetical protein